MAMYDYRAKGQDGQVVSGTMEAASERDLFQNLERAGQVPIRIVEAGVNNMASGISGWAASWGKGRVGAKHVVPFTRQLATMVKSGIPILASLDALWQQTEEPKLKAIIKTISRDIQGGTTLSRAMARHPKTFSSFYVNTLAAGEASGALGEVADGLADFLEDQQRTRSDVRGAMVYPAAMCVVLLGAIVFLSIFVVPRFAKMFSRFKSELPMPTKVLIAFSDFLLHYWWLGLLGVVGLTFALVHYSRTASGRLALDGMKMKLPVFGELFVSMAMHRFSEIMALLTRSGLPLLQTLEVASRTIGNEVVSQEVRRMEEDIAGGTNLSGAMAKAASFTPMTRHMIAIGEKSGSNEKMFRAISGHYDAKLKAMIRNMTTLIQPILTVVLAGFAMFLALAIFLPMWDMIKLFKGG
jgi:type II secretory pathway component PulF